MLRRCFGVFGDPIAHSRSPALHGAAFASLGLDHAYLPFHVPPAALAAALRGAAALGFGGVNLTVPHKQAALTLVDRCTPRAQRIGAINTVLFTADGTLVGDNTDSPGFAAALAELLASPSTSTSPPPSTLPSPPPFRSPSPSPAPSPSPSSPSSSPPSSSSSPSSSRLSPSPPPQRALVLGGGGAARAVVDALLHEVGVPWIGWVSRDPTSLPVETSGARARLHPLSYAAIRSELGADLLVHCTTVGMAGGPAALPIRLPLHTLGGEAPPRVIDIVYPRPPGGLLDQAAAAGAAVQDGLPMLLWQGVRALEAWLGAPLPASTIAAMRQALLPTRTPEAVRLP